MKMETIRKQRNIPFAKRGMRVFSTYNKRYGRISGANDSGNLNITFDGDNYSQNCHPWWMLQYLDSEGNIIKEFGK